MNSKQTTQEIRKLIAKGKLEEAANTLTDYFDKEMSRENKEQFQLYNQAINQLSSLSDLKRAELSGILRYEDAELERNKIRAGLLGIIGELEKGQRGIIKKTPGQSIQTKEESSDHKWKIIGSIVGILLVSVAIWMIATNWSPSDNTAAIDNEQSLVEEVEPYEDVPDFTIKVDENEQQNNDVSGVQNQAGADDNSSEANTPDAGAVQVVPSKPDLIITSYSISPSSPREMETATISIKVKNNGSAVAKDIEVGWWGSLDRLKPTEELTIDQLGAGAVKEWTFPYTWYRVGNNTAINSKVEIDYNKVISEEKENNNREELSFQIVKLAVDDNAPKADLVVKIIMPERVQMSARINITLEIKNIGNASANDFKTYWWASESTPNPSKRFTTESLAPGETKNLKFPFSWYSVVGSPERMVRAKVDAENSIPEESENNNTDSKKIEIIQ